MARRRKIRGSKGADRSAARVIDSSGPDEFEEAVRTADDVDVTPTGGRLGEVLVRRGVVDRDTVAKGVVRQDEDGGLLGEILVSTGAVTDDELTWALADQADVPIVEVRSVAPTAEAVAALPEPVARELSLVPLRIEDDTLHIVTADPSDVARVALEEDLEIAVAFHAASRADIVKLLDSSYQVLSGVDAVIERFESADTIRHAAEQIPESVTADDAPVIQLVNMIITQALRDRASDIHVEPTEGSLRLRYRIDGTLHDMLSLPASMANPVVSRIKILASLNIVERRRPQDGQISMHLEGSDLDIRVAIAPTIYGEKVVMRLLDKSNALFQYHELGMSPATEARFVDLIQSPYGMVVCSGPTGSGKTTTLYATLQALDSEELNITTIEDPVEYVLPTINQIQINPSADVNFVTGLRSILRQDPDVILVGEIRDTETARIAVRSALTGHLVLSSIHATDAASAIQRFVDMGIEPFLLTSSVIGVVAQRLVRRICSDCKVEYRPTADELAFYREAGGDGRQKFFKGEGCSFCAGTGYLGRIGVYELLTLNDAIREKVVLGASRDEIREIAIAELGMTTLREEGIDLVNQKVTTISEVVRHIWTI